MTLAYYCCWRALFRNGHAPAIIVIGASAGGIEAIGALTAAFPPDLDAAVFVVLHVGVHRSELPWLLNQRGPLLAVHPQSGEKICPGRIYVAPPDHHMVLEQGRILLTRGPRENWARPAIDPLFRSAADAYGPSVIGVILTGGLNDGTAGLYDVGQRGGVTIVQDPKEAASPSMPQSALRHVAVDHCLPLTEISALLNRLVEDRGARSLNDLTDSMPARSGEMTADYKLDRPVAVTCPDCGGALRRKETGTLAQFACHIGHVYTSDVLVAAQFSTMEWSMEAAMRAISERAELCRQMAADARKDGEPASAARWDAAEAQAKARTLILRELLHEEWLQAGEQDVLELSGR